MSDDISSAQLCENITRESLHLNQHLEKMTEQMENVSGNLANKYCIKYNNNAVNFFFFFLSSVKLSWMAYDMVVLRTSPDLAESFKSLENEFLKCKAVICGPTDGQDKDYHPATEEHNIPPK